MGWERWSGSRGGCFIVEHTHVGLGWGRRPALAAGRGPESGRRLGWRHAQPTRRWIDVSRETLGQGSAPEPPWWGAESARGLAGVGRVGRLFHVKHRMRVPARCVTAARTESATVSRETVMGPDGARTVNGADSFCRPVRRWSAVAEGALIGTDAVRHLLRLSRVRETGSGSKGRENGLVGDWVVICRRRAARVSRRMALPRRRVARALSRIPDRRFVPARAE